MSDGKKVTIVDIAKELNISNITVSRAFSHPDLVKEATRNLIYKTARKLKYSPNAFARNLKAKSSKLIGIVTDSTYNPVYAQVVKELYETAESLGYTLMMFETAGKVENEKKALKVLFSYNVAGIVLSVVNDSYGYAPSYVSFAKEREIPLVLLDRDLKQYKLPGVFLNNFKLGKMAGNYLQSQNVKKLLVVGGHKDSLITQERIRGLESVLSKKDVHIEILYSEYAYEKARLQLNEYVMKLRKNGTPFHFVGINGLISLAFISLCFNYSVKNINFFSIDEVPYARDFGFKVPCIYSSPFEWGKEISKLLFNLIENNNSMEFSKRIYIDGKLLN